MTRGQGQGEARQDEHRRASRRSPGQLGIQSIPTVFAFQDGQPVDGFMGALPESQITAFIERVLGGRRRGRCRARYRGDPQGRRRRCSRRATRRRAADLFAQVLPRIPATQGARRPRRAHVAARRDRARATDALRCVPEGQGERSGGRRRARRARACRPGGARSATSSALEAKLAANAADHQARFDLAVALERQGRAREGAPIICSRSCGATANGTTTARASSSSILRSLGADRRQTLEGRRRLSSILFA